MPNGLREDPKVFIAIAEDGTVTVLCHRSEMGQGVRTSWPMVVADELEADWAKMKVAQAQGDEPKFGNQDTDGSRSMRHHFMTLRRMGAAARQMLEAGGRQAMGRAGHGGRGASTTRSCTRAPTASSAMANWPRRRPTCRCRRATA